MDDIDKLIVTAELLRREWLVYGLSPKDAKQYTEIIKTLSIFGIEFSNPVRFTNKMWDSYST